MIKILLPVFLLVSISCVFSQTDPTNYNRTDLIPNSPTASSLAKVGEIPVNLYTGVPNVSFPIHSITDGSLSLPITLSYSFDGFKPASASSWVGLGWNINAGGVITRNIRDKPDDGAGAAAGTFDTITHILTLASEDQTFLKNIVTDGIIDGEPDLYSYNFLGYSGKFVIVREKIYLLPDKKLKIVASPGGFVITTPDGNKFSFFATELTTPHPSPGSSYTISSYISSFYLTKIENAAGTEEINLTYTSEGEILQHGPTMQSYKYIHPFQGDNQGAYQQSSQVFQKKGPLPTTVGSIRLSSIYTRNCNISFIPEETSRRDINQYLSGDSRALKEISVTGSGIGAIKNFKLIHHYKESTGFNGRILYLDSLYEISTRDEGIKTLKYGYEYNAINNLLTKTDAAVDYYGYYLGNGDFGNIILPSARVPEVLNTAPNREPNGSATQGALRKITYPTGGKVELEYEPNRYYTGDHYQQVSTTEECEVTGSPSYGQTNSSSNIYFSIGYNQNVEVQLSRVAHSPFADGNARNLYTDFRITYDDGDVAYVAYEGQIDLEADNGGKFFSIPLTAGDYYITTFIDGRETEMQALVTFFENGSPVLGEYGAGIRIKQITSTPGLGIPVTKKYHYTNEAGFSSGAMNVLPLFEQKEYTDEVAEIDAFRQIHSTIYTSSLSDFYGIGTPHYYTSVVEEVFSETGGLRSRHNFVSMESEGAFLGIEPTAVINYKQVGNSWQPVNRVEYDYYEATDTIIHAIKAYLRSKVIPAGGLYLPPDEKFSFEPYYLRKMWSAVKSQKEVIYNGTNILESTTQYIYDDNRNLKLVLTQDSKGNHFTKKLKYPEDYLAALSSNFLDAHVLSIPWEEQVWKKSGISDSVLISGKITKFNNHYLPDTIFALEIGTPITGLDNESLSDGLYNTLISSSLYKPQISFKYDNQDKLLTQKPEKNNPISYMWGYEGVYPIAEVVNANDGQFAYAGFDAGNTGGWSYSGNTTDDYNSPTFQPVYMLSSGGITKTGLINTTTYVLTLWTNAYPGPVVTGSMGASISSPIELRSQNGWKLIKFVISNSTVVNITGTVNIDDVRLYPEQAIMKTYSYFPLIGLAAETSPTGKTIFYEYDSFNRLHLVKDDEGNILKRICYNYAGQVEDCGVEINTTPLWESTSLTRCQPCPANNSYVSNIQEHQEKDNNPHSPTYNTYRWISDGVNSNCTPPADWQNTATAIRCKKDGTNQNTGEQEREQRDMNPCSPTYNQLRWIVTGTNTTACPLPYVCSSGNCWQEGYKCVYGNCELGVRICVSSAYDWETGMYANTYRYEWSDGSWSSNFIEMAHFACAFSEF